MKMINKLAIISTLLLNTTLALANDSGRFTDKHLQSRIELLNRRQQLKNDMEKKKTIAKLSQEKHSENKSKK